MARLGPFMKLALASIRMVVKLGDPITAEECSSAHRAVMAQLHTQEYAMRFVGATAVCSYTGSADALAAVSRWGSCIHQGGALALRSTEFAMATYWNVDTNFDAVAAWSLD